MTNTKKLIEPYACPEMLVVHFETKQSILFLSDIDTDTTEGFTDEFIEL